MKKYLILFFCLLAFVSCDGNEKAHPGAEESNGDLETTELEADFVETEDEEGCPPIDYSEASQDREVNTYYLTGSCWYSEYWNSHCPDDPECNIQRNWLQTSRIELDDQGCPRVVEGEKVCDTYCCDYTIVIEGNIYNASACLGESGNFFDGWKNGGGPYMPDLCYWGAGHHCHHGDIYTCKEISDDCGLAKIRRPMLFDCGDKGCIGDDASPFFQIEEYISPGFCVADQGPGTEDWKWESPNPKEGCPHDRPSLNFSGYYYPCPAKTFCHEDMIYGCAVEEDEWGCPQQTYVWEIAPSETPCGNYWPDPYDQARSR